MSGFCCSKRNYIPTAVLSDKTSEFCPIRRPTHLSSSELISPAPEKLRKGRDTVDSQVDARKFVDENWINQSQFHESLCTDVASFAKKFMQHSYLSREMTSWKYHTNGKVRKIGSKHCVV